MYIHSGSELHPKKHPKQPVIPAGPILDGSLRKASSSKTIEKNAEKNVVTNMSPSMHDENRVNIYVDDAFAFSLEISQVVDLGVKVGKSYTDEELEKFHDASEFGKLYTRTLEWVLSRPHSAKETHDYLVKKQLKRRLDNRHREQLKEYKKEHRDENPYRNPDNLDENGRLKFRNSRWAESTEILPEISDHNISLVMQKLTEKGFLDDEKFARFFVENRFIKKGVSETRLRKDLSAKGISKSLIDEVLSSSSRDNRSEIIKMIKKKRTKYSDSKLIAYLARQGFDYSLVKDCVENYSDEESL